MTDQRIMECARAAEEAADYEQRGRPYLEYERVGNWEVVARAVILKWLEQPMTETMRDHVMRGSTIRETYKDLCAQARKEIAP